DSRGASGARCRGWCMRESDRYEWRSSGRIDPLFHRIEAGDVLIVTQLACSTRDLLNVIAALAERCRLQLAFIVWGAGTSGTQALKRDGWHDAAVASEPVHTQPRAP